MSRECVENVYLHDNRLFLFFLQFHCQFYPFFALSEPWNIPGLFIRSHAFAEHRCRKISSSFGLAEHVCYVPMNELCYLPLNSALILIASARRKFSPFHLFHLMNQGPNPQHVRKLLELPFPTLTNGDDRTTDDGRWPIGGNKDGNEDGNEDGDGRRWRVE